MVLDEDIAGGMRSWIVGREVLTGSTALGYAAAGRIARCVFECSLGLELVALVLSWSVQR